MISNLNEIEKVLHLEEGTLESAIKADEEQAITLEGLNVYNADELNALKENIKKEEYLNGKIAGEEMAVKSVRDEYGLDFEGKKIKNFAEAFKAKIESESKKAPSQKIQELETDIEKLRGNATEWETKYNELQTSYSNEKKQYKINDLIQSNLPEGVILPKDKIITLFKMDYDIDFDEGTPIIKKGDNILKDEKTRNPLPLNDVLSGWLNDNKFVQEVAQGRGGGNSRATNTKGGTLEAFIEEMGEAGINSASLEFQKEMQERIKNGSLKL